MLRSSRIDPRISAYNQIWGNFDFNRTLLAPTGCKVIVHKSPEHQELFAYHGVHGFYIIAAMNHYQYYQIYIPVTGGVRIAATVDFYPKHVQMPLTSSEDKLAAKLEDLSKILKTLT